MAHRCVAASKNAGGKPPAHIRYLNLGPSGRPAPTWRVRGFGLVGRDDLGAPPPASRLPPLAVGRGLAPAVLAGNTEIHKYVGRDALIAASAS